LTPYDYLCHPCLHSYFCTFFFLSFFSFISPYILTSFLLFFKQYKLLTYLVTAVASTTIPTRMLMNDSLFCLPLIGFGSLSVISKILQNSLFVKADFGVFLYFFRIKVTNRLNSSFRNIQKLSTTSATVFSGPGNPQ